MAKSKMEQHKFEKGIFYSPWNSAFKDLLTKISSSDWVHNCLPEYLWLGLIIDFYGRKRGLDIAGGILVYLAKEIKTESARFSEILNLTAEKQKNFFSYCLRTISKTALAPLTVLFTLLEAPIFADYFLVSTMDVQTRLNTIFSVIEKTDFHQNELSTDIRFLEVWHMIFLGKLHFPEGMKEPEGLVEYPQLEHSDEKMRWIRPFIRSTEGTINIMTGHNEKYIKSFWDKVGSMSDCQIVVKPIKKQTKLKVIKADFGKFESIMDYYSKLVRLSPLDEKMLVLVGIANYSFKRLRELVEHNLYNTASGRSIIRVMIEDLIMMKYLLNNEKDHVNIWRDFQYYGIGQYKLISTKFKDCSAKNDLQNSHVDYSYLDLLVNEFINEDFMNMDTTYFDKKQIRKKAEEVGEKNLFDFYYDYDSQYEHGLWGAIRECSMLKCTTAGHKYHNVPDIFDAQKLPSIWNDCRMVMKKTTQILKQEFGLPITIEEVEDVE